MKKAYSRKHIGEEGTINAILTGLSWYDENDVPPAVLEAYSYPHPFDNSIFRTYVKHNGKVGLPYGNIEKLKKLMPNTKITDRRVAPPISKPFTLTGLTLRPYQEECMTSVFKYINDGGCTFNLAGKAGSGKSVLISAILARLGVKTLAIAHMSLLTEQLAKEISEATNANVVTLNAKNLELGDVSVATSQFISQRPELWKEIKYQVGCIVVDESETAASLTTLRILQRAHARYRIFVSATFTRSTDRRTEALLDLSGPKMIILERPDLLVPNVMVITCPERYPPYTSKFTYAREKQKFFRQYSITEKVLFLVRTSLLKERSVLIATDIILMQEDLSERLKEFGVGILNGQTKRADRGRILKEFDEGTLKVLIGANVLNAGLSIPRISTIVRVSFPSSPEKSVQLIGRALRDFDGKDGAYIFDLVFKGKSAHKRVAAYKANGYKVSHHSWSCIREKLSD